MIISTAVSELLPFSSDNFPILGKRFQPFMNCNLLCSCWWCHNQYPLPAITFLYLVSVSNSLCTVTGCVRVVGFSIQSMPPSSDTFPILS